jgi:hypothetical protein
MRILLKEKEAKGSKFIVAEIDARTNKIIWYYFLPDRKVQEVSHLLKR